MKSGLRSSAHGIDVSRVLRAADLVHGDDVFLPPPG